MTDTEETNPPISTVTVERWPGRVETLPVQECSECGALVADSWRHENWHRTSEDPDYNWNL